MFTKTKLIKWIIALALLAVATVTGLALAAENGEQATVSEAETASVAQKEIIPAESMSDYQYAHEYSDVLARATETKMAPASVLEVIPAESLPDYWRAEAGQATDVESERPYPQRIHLKFDAVEDMTRFAFDESKTFEDGLPAHGSSFITQGYIYEYGTISDSNGVLPDGSPEFPDKVIGTWVCKGWLIGDAAHATEGAWVVTTQIFNFGEEYGRNTIVSEGYESAVFGESITRAITGGTGEYVGAKGEANQILLGFNEGTEGVNLRFELDVTR